MLSEEQKAIQAMVLQWTGSDAASFFSGESLLVDAATLCI